MLTSIASSILERTPNAPLDALVEENVCALVVNLSKAPAMQDAWEGGKTMLWIHGLVHKIEDGTFEDLEVSMGLDVNPEAEKEKAEKEKAEKEKNQNCEREILSRRDMYLDETMFFNYTFRTLPILPLVWS
ncbi:hypothetical protein FIBSPDRAFT_995741 [Athelia psychrophila]|uniref:Carbonic anhydrase n=1 Tax=Athelia psychrophila TaxID=1759441 RepID=A0A165X8R2_9AGAM|nr:hypothetical protein FIBSPDRAFT_995741 [Fibularhizoctonia sp. CBS 109695]